MVSRKNAWQTALVGGRAASKRSRDTALQGTDALPLSKDFASAHSDPRRNSAANPGVCNQSYVRKI